MTVTGGSNTVEANKCIETGSCSTEKPRDTERHKSSRAQGAKAEEEEGLENVRVCPANSVPFL